MASYVQSTLLNGETVLYEARISLWRSWLSIFFGTMCLLSAFMGSAIGAKDASPGPLYVLGGGLLLLAYLRYVTTELAVTDRRVVAKFGILSRRTIEMTLSRVESIRVSQGIMGRIFNFGSLAISGAGNPQVPIPGISKPMDFRKMAMDAIDHAGANNRPN